MAVLESVKNNQFKFKKLNLDEMKARGILGQLYGPCASFKAPTRNGRMYSEQLWENVFSDPIMKEKIKNGVCFGELGHPADRTETDMEKIAICLREQPVKDENGQLLAVFDILDTPNGRILKTLCDYGSIIGISSRGQGDLIQEYDGNESVDPDTYECECFDAVLVPAVESARMQYIKEGLDIKEVKLKRALTESLQKANADERKVMEDTLKDLNIVLTEDKDEEVIEEVADETTEVEETPVEEIEATETEEIKVEDEVTQPEVSEEEIEETAVEEIIEEPEADIEAESEAEEANVEETEDITIEIPTEDDEEIEITLDKLLDLLVDNFGEEKINQIKEIILEPETAKESDEVIDIEASEESEDVEQTTEDEVIETSEEAVDDGIDELLNNLKETLQKKSNLEKDVQDLQEKLAVSDTKVTELTEECERYKNALARVSEVAKSSKELKDQVSNLTESIKEKEQTIEEQQAKISRLVEARKQILADKKAANTATATKEAEIKSLNESLTSNKEKADSEIQTLQEQLTKKDTETKAEIAKLNESLTKATSLKESYKKLANKVVNKYIDLKAGTLGLTATDIKRKLGESYSIEDVDQVCEDLKSYQLNVSRLPFSVNKQRVSIKVNEATVPSRRSKTDDDDVDDSLIKLANL